MKVLALWQPYASLIAHGRKSVETRDWPAQRYHLVGQRVAIQATKGTGAAKDGGGEPAFRARCASEPFRTVLAELGFATPAQLPRAAILATAVIERCVRQTEENTERLRRLNPVEWHFGNYDWEEGRYAFVLQDVELLPEPVPFSGHQGIPEVDDELLGYARTPAGLTRSQPGLFDARASA